jgi:AraC family transcriptional regulator of adaptative response / DNA-3-methyladenine glycosylase II
LTVELAVTPRGPFSLQFSARLSSDATRTFRDGLFTQVLAVENRVEVARAWQVPDGTVAIVAESQAGADRMRWLLALDDDHSDFLRLVRDDPMLGRASRALRGLRPIRVPTVAQALLRAFCGQLIEAKVARRLEQTIIRKLCVAGPDRLHVSPTTSDLASIAPAQLRAIGLHTRRAAALVRLCRSLELERLHDQPTATIAQRLERERGLGPWSVGVVCLEGLGRMDYGLVGDLGLVKLLRALRGRPVEGWETAELLEPYGEWAGLASMYLLAGFARGLLPVSEARAA